MTDKVGIPDYLLLKGAAMAGDDEESEVTDSQQTEKCSCGIIKPCQEPTTALRSQGGWNVPVCLMHSTDPRKDATAFQSRFEEILKEARDGIADFSGFVFPSAEYRKRDFTAHCLFRRAWFLAEANFAEAIFRGGSDFSQAAFARDVVFYKTRFEQYADFTNSTFDGRSDFMETVFVVGAAFGSSLFDGRPPRFVSSRFMGDADFRFAYFTNGSEFLRACFEKDADFSFATLTSVADFQHARFLGRVDFGDAKFRGDEIPKPDRTWRWPRLCPASPGSANEEPDAVDSLAPGPIFVKTYFEKPDQVIFSGNHLGRAVFLLCNVSKIIFFNVRWPKRKNGRCMVLEEIVPFTGPDFINGLPVLRSALRAKDGAPGGRNYRLIEELYHQLKKNYDDRQDYWTAGDFHYGEMEMKRLATSGSGRITRWFIEKGASQSGSTAPAGGMVNPEGSSMRQRAWGQQPSVPAIVRFLGWWHRTLGVVAWYKRFSEYGESYLRPLGCLAMAVFLFGLLYPWIGLQYSINGEHLISVPSSKSGDPNIRRPTLSYARPFPPGYQGGVWRARRGLVRDGLIASADITTFQRDLPYKPAYRLGHILALAQSLLTSTLVALFLLAVRRQFRR